MADVKAIVVRGRVNAITVGKPGPPGVQGAQGQDGQAGAAGSDATVTAQAVISALVAALPMLTITLGGTTPPSQATIDTLVSWGINADNILWAETAAADNTLTVANLTSESSIDGVVLTLAGGNLVAGDITSATSIDSVELSNGSTFSVEDVVSGSSIDAVALIGNLVVADLTSASSVDNVVLATTDGETTVWTDGFADLTNWTNSDGTNGASIVSGKCRLANAVIRRAAAVGPVCSIEVKVTRNAATNNPRVYLVNGISGVSGAPGYLVNHFNGTLLLYKIDNTGATTQIGSWTSAFTVGQQYTVKMAIGATGEIVVSVDGTARITVTDTTYSTFTNAILYSTDASNTADFDDVVVKN